MKIRLRQSVAAQHLKGIGDYLDKKDKIIKFSQWKTTTKLSLMGNSSIPLELNHQINLNIAHKTKSLNSELKKRYRDIRKGKEIVAKFQKNDESLLS